jgi:ribonuclease HI
MKNAIIYTDGGSRGNPGHAAYGAVIKYSNGEKDSIKAYFGIATNNQMEYQALLMALEVVSRERVDKVLVKSDSLLMVNQIKGLYSVKDATLAKIYDKIIQLLPNFKEFAIMHIPREQNTEADALVNEVLDAKLGRRVSKRTRKNNSLRK